MLERGNIVIQVLPMYVNEKLRFIVTPLLLFHFKPLTIRFFPQRRFVCLMCPLMQISCKRHEVEAAIVESGFV